MRKVIYIISTIALLFSLQSCDRVGKFIDGTPNSQQLAVENQNGNNEVDSSVSSDSMKTAKMQSQIERKDSVIKVLNDSLSSINDKIQIMQTDVDTANNKLKVLEQKKIGLKSLFVFLFIFVIVVVVIVVVVVQKLSKQEIKKNMMRYSCNDTSENHRVSCLEQNVNNIQRNINKIKIQLNDLTNGMAASKANVNAVNNQQSWEAQIAAVNPQQGVAESKKQRANSIFYMKRPQNDMEFVLSLQTFSATDETFYRFEVDVKNPNEARFVFDCNSADGVRWALSTKDKTLDRVCYASGDGNNGKYKCTAPGEAKLQDGKWIVTRKAVVIFE